MTWQVGEIVRAVIDTARVERVEPEGLVLEVGASQVLVPLDEEAVEVERVAPAEWPPRPGDVWAGEAALTWFGVRTESDGNQGGVVLVPSSLVGKRFVADLADPGVVLQEYGPMRLVHREPPELAAAAEICECVAAYSEVKA